MNLARILEFVVRSGSPRLLQWTYKALYYSDRYWAKRGKQKMLSAIRDACPQLSFVLYDLGAAGGIDPTYLPLHGFHGFRAIGFEPGKQEEADLRQRRDMEFHPYAVAGGSGVRTLHITKAVGSSSLFPPNQEAVAEFPIADVFAVTGTEELKVVSLDDFVATAKVPYADFLKLDVQGAEYEILKNSPATLRHVLGLSLETRMREMYTGEGTFPMMHSFLVSEGFRLISKVAGSPHFSGETLELDVVYVRGGECLKTEEQVIKAVVFCILHENLTYAAHLVRRSTLSEDRKSLLLRLLRKDFGFAETPETYMMKRFLDEDLRRARAKQDRSEPC